MTVQERISERAIGVIGMGRSGLSSASLAAAFGGVPFVSDAAPADRLAEAIAQLKQEGIACETDRHTDRLLKSDYIIVSPGVPPEIDILKKAEARGIPVFSEIEFASWVCRGKIIGVTGSNGKTTTTTLIGEILSAAGLDTFVCGNIGLPFAQVADKIGQSAVAVVEVSTFQLERIADFAPRVAMILNLSPDHLDRHGSFEAYKNLKYRITENQKRDDYLILNAQDKEIMGDNVMTVADKLYFTTEGEVEHGAFVKQGDLCIAQGGRGLRIVSARDIRIPGPHNLQNAAAAVTAATLFDVDPAIMARVLKTFPGVEHRLESVARVAGIDFVNDSKATNVDAVCYALRSINTRIHLIAGGRDKGASYQPLSEYGRGRIASIVLIGEAQEKMYDSLGRHFPTQFADSLEEAVKVSFAQARPGDTVLLSPACASFDMFDNFEQRGKSFKAAVADLKRDRKENETTVD